MIKEQNGGPQLSQVFTKVQQGFVTPLPSFCFSSIKELLNASSEGYKELFAKHIQPGLQKGQALGFRTQCLFRKTFMKNAMFGANEIFPLNSPFSPDEIIDSFLLQICYQDYIARYNKVKHRFTFEPPLVFGKKIALIELRSFLQYAQILFDFQKENPAEALTSQGKKVINWVEKYAPDYLSLKIGLEAIQDVFLTFRHAHRKNDKVGLSSPQMYAYRQIQESSGRTISGLLSHAIRGQGVSSTVLLAFKDWVRSHFPNVGRLRPLAYIQILETAQEHFPYRSPFLRHYNLSPDMVTLAKQSAKGFMMLPFEDFFQI